ncbi:universal stress protein [Actinomadura barringtoniae]|uniref:Universal stress protein n=1 Tax=Actinomadura barringtoniae TaxID=1427535 RepID=A0A939PLL6_9ACTN|nr:universal stress protein [Actinomadura barringtoniae]MBO2455202.1 universal stress protein [Actinomadura barringtoniae]
MTEIVVGTDGSENSLVAIDWAAREAGRRNASLRIVYAIAPWLFDTPVDPGVGAVRDWIRGDGQDVVDRSIARALRAVPDLRVTGAMAEGQPAARLIEEARHAAMVVVGTRGTSGVSGLLLGSVAFQLVSHAPCPAVVVRGEEHPEYGEIVVGIDGSTESSAAAGFAFEEAALRHARLRAVLAWSHPHASRSGDQQPPVYDAQTVTAGEERVLAESLAGWREKYPEVRLVYEVVHARPARALAGESARADLLVLGSRGRGGFTGLMLGSVGQSMLHLAHCPLTVVPSSVGFRP